MASLAQIAEDWAEGQTEKSELYTQYKGVVLRWINEAQLRYCDKSEILTGLWQPTITSSGNIALPADFLREIKDWVYWSSTIRLVEIDYPTAIVNQNNFSGAQFYSIWNDTFYVWAATAGTPQIPYIKKPAVVAIADIATASLEIPLEFQHNLLTYLDAVFLRRKGDYKGYGVLLANFDMDAAKDGLKFKQRRERPPIIRSTRF